MHLIRQFCLASCLIAGVVLPGCNDRKREATFSEFLTDHDPALKAKRDEIVGTIAEIRKQRDSLKTARKQYKSQRALDLMNYKIKQVDAELDALKGKLADFDAEIEVAMVNKDSRSADAGGLLTKESKELLDNADAVLKQAEHLGKLLDNEGEEPPPPQIATKPPATQPVAASKSRTASQPEPKTKAGVRPSPPPQTTKPAAPPPDREAIAKEIHRLDAAIATDEANLQRAWDRVNQMTKNLTVPIVKGSRQYVEYMPLERIIEDCESRLPAMKNQRGQLQRQLEGQ